MRSDGFGILVKGYNFLPGVGIPYNYANYYDLFSAYGFKKLSDHMLGYLYAKNSLPEKLHRIADKVRERMDFGLNHLETKKKWCPGFP